MDGNPFLKIQRLGRALMLPIAVLPVAGLLLRLGQPDVFNIKMIADAGGAIFDNLPLLFAIGVAVGFAKDNNGVAALAGAIGYLVQIAVMKDINDKLNMGVLSGIVAGIVAGLLYNRYKDIKLPDYLAFFGGKRFVPIVTGVVCLAIGIVFGYVWQPVQGVIDTAGHWLTTAGALGAFVFGVLNRLLLVTGLHHILNSLTWFVFGNFTPPGGAAVTGDLHRFFAGDPTAGGFMAGFFPIMMFGLPAACLAMFHEAPKERRAVVGGLLFSMALTSFLTGVTEPIEFSFMFLAPVLYVIHALLTGLSLAICSAFTLASRSRPARSTMCCTTACPPAAGGRFQSASCTRWCTTVCSASSSASSTWRRRAANRQTAMRRPTRPLQAATSRRRPELLRRVRSGTSQHWAARRT